MHTHLYVYGLQGFLVKIIILSHIWGLDHNNIIKLISAQIAV